MVSQTNPQFFTDKQITDVWEKGKIGEKNDNEGTIWRRDCCGAWIKRNEHGNTDSKYGWQIDHIKPTSKGGFDTLSNLQPLQWKNNLQKGDGEIKCNIVGMAIKGKDSSTNFEKIKCKYCVEVNYLPVFHKNCFKCYYCKEENKL